MKTLFSIIQLGALLAFGVGSLAHAGAKPEVKPKTSIATLLALRGALLVDDDGVLDRRKPKRPKFESGVEVKAWMGSWERSADSVAWRSTWNPGMGHTPVVNYTGFRETNLIVEVTFRYGEMSEPWHDQCFRIALDDRPTLTGHVLSAWANRNNDFIDTGFLLQHIRKTKEKKILKNLHLDRQTLNVDPGKWYTVVVEVVGDEALFRMGDHVAYAKSDELSASKNLVSLTLGKTWHEVKRVRIWKAEPNPNWKKVRAHVLKARTKFTTEDRTESK